MPIISAFIATVLISVISLIGAVFIAFRKNIEAYIKPLIALSAGTMLGATFFHLLPEAQELLPAFTLSAGILVAFIFFFFVERFLHWRHCHKTDCETHTIGYMNLIGDGVHNFLDGLLIAGAFAISPELGWITTFAIALHEIPQEIGDFGVLLHAGFSKQKALLFNLLAALASVVGVAFGFALINKVEFLELLLLPVAIGGFLYIAASDLLPELRKEKSGKPLVLSLGLFLFGVILMLGLTVLVPTHEHDHETEEHSHHEESEQDIFEELHLEEETTHLESDDDHEDEAH